MVVYATTSGITREFGDINIISIKNGIANVVQDLVSLTVEGNTHEKRFAEFPVPMTEDRVSLWRRLNDNSDTIIDDKSRVVKVKMAD